MQKFKQALFFIIPFVVLIILLVIPFVLNQNQGFIGGAYYLKLFVNDNTFWTALLNTYGKVILFALIPVIVYNVIRRKIKIQFLNSFLGQYLVNVLLGGVVSLVVLLLDKAVWMLAIIIALQTGVLLAFVVWLIESVKTKKGIQ